MRGVNRPTPGQQRPQDRSGDRSDGRTGGIGAQVATVAAVVVGTSVLAATASAAAQATTSGALTGGQSVSAVSVAQSDPMIFGLGPAGLFWLLAGLLALVVGLVLATRRAHRPATDGGSDRGPTIITSNSNDRPGGAEK